MLGYGFRSDAFPVGLASGFDPSHRAAINARCSAVSCSGSSGFTYILKRSSLGTFFNNTGISKIDSIMGPCINMNNSDFRNSGMLTTNDVSITIAAIFSLNSINFNRSYFQSSTALTGWGLFINGSQVITLLAVGGGGSSGVLSVSAVTNIPYFVIASYDGTVARFLTKRLDIGSVITGSQTVTLTPSAPNGTYDIGGINSTSWGFDNIAAVMFSATALGLADMLAWSADPWSFWYPDPIFDYSLVGQQAVATMPLMPQIWV